MRDIELILRDEFRRLAAREVRRVVGTSSLLERRLLHMQKRNRLLQRRLTVLSREISKLRVELDRRLAPARQDRQLIPSADLPSPQEVRFLRRSLGCLRLCCDQHAGAGNVL